MLYERIKLEEEEKILLTVRKHWWVIATRTAFTLFMTLLPVIIYNFLNLLDLGFVDASVKRGLNETYSAELMFLFGCWILINWMILANAWTDHYLDLWTITNRRVVSIDQRGFFHRFLSSFRLERLQDMNIEVKGFLPTLLNFGTIEAQTAGGSNEEFISNNMPDPRGLKATIIQAADERQRVMNQSQFPNDGVS